MKYTEELDWILDKTGAELSALEMRNKFDENIAFVHSLGLKCDCVGWCSLDLSDSRTEDILRAIDVFCKTNGWQARGSYRRIYTTFDSDWYELVPSYFKDSTPSDWTESTDENGETIRIQQIRAFHEMTAKPKAWGKELFVPDRFRKACIKLGIRDLDFCWARDKGKYEAEQYFHVYGKRQLPHIAVDWELKKSRGEDFREVGGWLPRIAEVFHTMQQINLPDCYLKADLPEGGIVYAYIPMTFSTVGKNKLLIHKDTARLLLEEKALPASALRPAPVVEELPAGYSLKQTQRIPRPSYAVMEQMLSEYEKLKATPLPVRKVTEKDALKLLRAAKKERKEDFQKGLSKAKAQESAQTRFAAMAAYYSVSNGGYLSDEYELFPYARAVEETKAFANQLEAEELLAEKPAGIVIAKCPNGDVVVRLDNGTVIRSSHEAPEITDQWPSVAQFVVEAVQDSE